MFVTGVNTLQQVSKNDKSKKAASASKEKFSLTSEELSEAKEMAATRKAAGVSGVSSLFALQDVEAEREQFKETVHYSGGLLKKLEALRDEILSGALSLTRLQEMSSYMERAVRSSDPRLNSLVDDIEIRLAVEIAKWEKRFLLF